MTTCIGISNKVHGFGVVEAYRLDRYDNLGKIKLSICANTVVEAYRLDRYDNS